MTKSIFCSVVGLALGVAAAGCFSKPGFSGSDANSDGATDAPFVEPACGAGLKRLPDNIKLRTDQFSIDDLDRNRLDDVALIGEDASGGQHVFIYFGQPNRTIDLNCWDHQIAATDFTFTSGSRLPNGNGDGEGTVFAVRDYFYADNNVVAGARFPQWNTGTHPSRPTFQTVRNDGFAKTCYFDLATTNDLTDGTVVLDFSRLNTTFAGVLTANPSGNTPTNRLLVVPDWNSDSCDTGNGSPRLYQLRTGTKPYTEPLIIGGKFQNGRKQLMLFYQESPTDGECFEELIGNPQHCLAHCGEQTCAL